MAETKICPKISKNAPKMAKSQKICHKDKLYYIKYSVKYVYALKIYYMKSRGRTEDGQRTDRGQEQIHRTFGFAGPIK